MAECVWGVFCHCLGQLTEWQTLTKKIQCGLKWPQNDVKKTQQPTKNKRPLWGEIVQDERMAGGTGGARFNRFGGD